MNLAKVATVFQETNLLLASFVKLNFKKSRAARVEKFPEKIVFKSIQSALESFIRQLIEGKIEC